MLCGDPSPSWRDGVESQKPFAGGWPNVNGLDLTPDGSWLVAGIDGARFAGDAKQFRLAAALSSASFPSAPPVKPATLLLAGSLAANAALVALYVKHSPVTAGATAAAAAKPAPVRAGAAANDSALRAAGVPADVARDLALGRAFSRIAEKVRAARAAQAADGRWWRQRDAAQGSREEWLQLRREISDAMFAAFGDDLSTVGAGASSLAFLSPEKRDALRRITQDYDEMMAKFGAGGIQLPSDREKLRLLRAERDRDIAALLSPDERLAYELRTSPSALAVRARYGDGLETEDDFRKLYALQKAFDEKYPMDATTGRVSPETMRQRMDAQRQLQEDMRAALGEDKFAALRRASDSDLRNVESLVSRLNLPAATTNQVAAARETYGAESQRINADASLNAQDRRAQIQQLGNRARSELARTLGAEAADAYAQRSPWVSMLQGGVAFTTTPQPGTPNALMAGQSVFPVMPAGGGPANVRQVITTGGGVVDAAPVHGDLFLAPAGGAPVVRDTVQVMTFSSGGTGDPAAAGGSGAPVERRLVVPAPATVTPPPAPKQ